MQESPCEIPPPPGSINFWDIIIQTEMRFFFWGGGGGKLFLVAICFKTLISIFKLI